MCDAKQTIQNKQEITYSSSHKVASETALRKIIPAAPSLLDKRIQPTLDFFSLEFINQACVVILGTSSSSPMIPLVFKTNIKVENETQLILSNLPDNYSLSPSEHTCYASLFFMVPGIGHSLRINGTLTAINTHDGIFNIEGVYFHCARAAARSDLFGNNQAAQIRSDITKDNIINQSPYGLLKTHDIQAKTEISPRGDEAGFIKTINNNTVFMPERPGNKVAVSLRNIINNPNIELLLLLPNTGYTLNIRGQAHVTTDPTLLALSDVNGKQAKIGVVIEVTSKQFQFDQRLATSGLWDNKAYVDKKTLTPFSKALSSHMKGTGLMGKATTLVVDAIVKHDMKNLY
jgi:predicted pyridoxine 5'-phosphate oxidase superfamily flavin-nucleotide-binding protein